MIKFNEFQSSSTASSTDHIVGYNNTSFGGERRWTVGTILSGTVTSSQNIAGATGEGSVVPTTPKSGSNLQFKKIKAGTGISVADGANDVTISTSGGGGTVTNVTGTFPISVTGGTTTPLISIAAATAFVPGTMSSTDKTRIDSASVVNGLVKCNGSGTFSAAVAGTDYLTSANFTGTNQNLTASGYQRLPGGLIIQWGFSMVAYGTTFTGTFPIAFPTRCLSIVGTSAPNIPPQTSALIFVQATPHSTNFATAFNIVSYHISLATGTNAVYWMAIGH